MPKVPNDPNHPLRPFTFAWIFNSHIRASGWAAHVYRDEFHCIEKVIRVRCGKGVLPEGIKLGTFYRIDDEDGEITYDELMAIMVERHGEFASNIEKHPVVIAWKEGKEIEYTPSPPAFPEGSTVRLNWSGLPADMFQEQYDSDDRRGVVVKGNALYVLVDWGKNKQWQPVRGLELADNRCQERAGNPDVRGTKGNLHLP